jgi:hypothetical protein
MVILFLRNRVLIEGLARNQDYNITVLSPNFEPQNLHNVHYIHLEKTYDVMFSGKNPVSYLKRAEQSSAMSIVSFGGVNLAACEGVLKSQGLDIVINYPSDFKVDLVLYDFLFGPCLLPLLHKFNYPPLVGVSAFNIPSIKRNLIGGHVFPAYGMLIVSEFKMIGIVFSSSILYYGSNKKSQFLAATLQFISLQLGILVRYIRMKFYVQISILKFQLS